jgi:ribonuclease-3
MNSDNTTPYNLNNTLVGITEIEKLISCCEIGSIHNVNIYRRAFVHKSYCTRKNENYINGNLNCPTGCMPLQEESNERLEFLGDSILSLIVASYLFERYPGVNEGFLTTMRTKLVNGKMLAFLSKSIGLGSHIIMSQQIESSNGRENKNILEDTFEAFIAAIYLDSDSSQYPDASGYDNAKKWVVAVLEEHVDFVELMKTNINFKDKLIKTCQNQYQFVPLYYEIAVTEKHGSKEHTVCIRNNVDEIIGIGKGETKKIAELNASKKALSYFGISV